jgi:hypothetical protein
MKTLALVLLLAPLAWSEPVTYTIRNVEGVKMFEVVTADFMPSLPQWNGGLELFPSQMVCESFSPYFECSRVTIDMLPGNLPIFSQYLRFLPDPFTPGGLGFVLSFPSDLSRVGIFPGFFEKAPTLTVAQVGDPVSFAPEPSSIFLSLLAFVLLSAKYARRLVYRAINAVLIRCSRRQAC